MSSFASSLPIDGPMRRTWIDRRSILGAPIEEVHALLADLDGWPAWTPGLVALRRKPGPLVPGRTRFAMHLKMNPLPALPVPCQLLWLDDHCIAWGGGAPGTRILHRFELTALPGGLTELRHVEDATTVLGLILRPFESVFLGHDNRWSDAIEAKFPVAG